MSSSKSAASSGRRAATVAVLMAGALLMAGPASGSVLDQVAAAAGSALDLKAPVAKTAEPMAPEPKASEAKGTEAAKGTEPKTAPADDSADAKATGSAPSTEGSAFAVSVAGGPALSARPAAKVRTCPDDQISALASSDAAPLLITGPIDVRVACTSDGTSLRSRAVVTAVGAGPEAPARVMKAKVIAAECAVEGSGTKGNTVISGLEGSGRVVGDIKNPAPNTDLGTLLPGLTGTINEQVVENGRIVVNGMRLKLGATEMIFGHVECGTGAAAAGVKGGEGTPVKDPAKDLPKGTPTTVAGPTTTKVKGGGKDKDAAVTTTVVPTTVVTATTTRPAVVPPGGVTTTTAKAAQATGKGGKSLAKTGPVTGLLLLLAAAALGVGALLRLGGDAMPAFAFGRRRREADGSGDYGVGLSHRSASTWSPRSSTADAGQSDGAIDDARNYPN